MAEGRERQRKAREIKEERGSLQASEVEEGCATLGLLQRSGAGSGSDLESGLSENDEVRARGG